MLLSVSSTYMKYFLLTNNSKDPSIVTVALLWKYLKFWPVNKCIKQLLSSVIIVPNYIIQSFRCTETICNDFFSLNLLSPCIKLFLCFYKSNLICYMLMCQIVDVKIKLISNITLSNLIFKYLCYKLIFIQKTSQHVCIKV